MVYPSSVVKVSKLPIQTTGWDSSCKYDAEQDSLDFEGILCGSVERTFKHRLICVEVRIMVTYRGGGKGI